MRGSLRAVDLEKRFGSRKVVANVTIEVGGGEIVGFLGPNGAGKTTTFSILMGLVSPDRGRVFFRDEDITGLPMFRRARKGIGFLPQEPSAFRKMDVEDNLTAVLEGAAGGRGDLKRRTSDALAEFGLEAVVRSRAVTLSGGERRRLEIARAMILNPDVLLLDEPFTGVDPLAVHELQEILRSLAAKGIGILLTDHSVRETLRITDRAYILDGGRVIKSGTPGDLVSSASVRKSYLGDGFRL
jgi:lipopolysaccharide export system ATP-binding protein